MMSQVISHRRQVMALYKGILKLHRGLLPEMQAVGTEYVKAEFRLHKYVGEKQAAMFLEEWAKYYLTLAKQLAAKKREPIVGQNLSEGLLNCFSEEQLGQLFELFQEAKKTVTDQLER